MIKQDEGNMVGCDIVIYCNKSNEVQKKCTHYYGGQRGKKCHYASGIYPHICSVEAVKEELILLKAKQITDKRAEEVYKTLGQDI